jgi:hypothetical protein
MLRRLLILDAGLVVLIVLGGMKLTQDWRAFGPTHDVAGIQSRPQVFPALPSTTGANASETAAWTEIPTKDPFSFDRNDIDIVVAEAPPKPVGPKPVLFGVMVIGNDKTAFVASGPTGNRNSRPMKVGEEIDGWTIVEIATKSIEIQSNGQRQTVILNDPSAAIPRDASRTAAASAPTPTVIQSSQPPVPGNVSTPNAGTTAQPQAPPAPPGKTGHWEQTPFGMKWYDDPPRPRP